MKNIIVVLAMLISMPVTAEEKVLKWIKLNSYSERVAIGLPVLESDCWQWTREVTILHVTNDLPFPYELSCGDEVYSLNELILNTESDCRVTITFSPLELDKVWQGNECLLFLKVLNKKRNNSNPTE